MTRQTVRTERTLSAPSTLGQEAGTATHTTTVIKLPQIDLRATPGDSTTLPEARQQAASVPQPNEPPADAGRPAPVRRREAKAGALKILLKALLWAAAFPLLSVLSFIVVLRVAVTAYQKDILAGWASLGVGVIAAVVFVCICIAAFIWTFGIGRKFFMPMLNVCLAAMLCYSGYALFHLAKSNAKTAEVRSYYTSLHPFLRVAIKNLALVDEDLVITDTRRTRGDYGSMGLPAREQSLHFRQATGFVHAVDMRTKGRSKTANLLIELYFVLMGFETIRHVGTADHLHVSLPFVDTGISAASPGRSGGD